MDDWGLPWPSNGIAPIGAGTRTEAERVAAERLEAAFLALRDGDEATADEHIASALAQPRGDAQLHPAATAAQQLLVDVAEVASLSTGDDGDDDGCIDSALHHATTRDGVAQTQWLVAFATLADDGELGPRARGRIHAVAAEGLVREGRPGLDGVSDADLPGVLRTILDLAVWFSHDVDDVTML